MRQNVDDIDLDGQETSQGEIYISWSPTLLWIQLRTSSVTQKRHERD